MPVAKSVSNTPPAPQVPDSIIDSEPGSLAMSVSHAVGSLAMSVSCAGRGCSFVLGAAMSQGSCHTLPGMSVHVKGLLGKSTDS